MNELNDSRNKMEKNMKELILKEKYVGWDFEPNLKKVKNIFINGHKIDFKLISVIDEYNDGHATLSDKCLDAILYIPAICGLELEIKLTDFIKQSKVFANENTH